MSAVPREHCHRQTVGKKKLRTLKVTYIQFLCVGYMCECLPFNGGLTLTYSRYICLSWLCWSIPTVYSLWRWCIIYGYTIQILGDTWEITSVLILFHQQSFNGGKKVVLGIWMNWNVNNGYSDSVIRVPTLSKKSFSRTLFINLQMCNEAVLNIVMLCI